MLVLNRHTSTLFNTLGVLVYERQVLCHTLELPWRHNAKEISCIPSGEYPVVRTVSPKFGDVYYIRNVPDREGVLIHVGNTISDTRGCVLVGLDAGPNGLLESRLAMKRLLSALPDTFHIQIIGGSK